MAIASLVSSASIQAMSPAATLTDVSTDALGDAIAALAARLHAATYELLILLREFDSRTDWHGGFASCAHWLHWRTGIALGAAREKVRVAHALATLPLVSATMARGAISYAKVRALTRVATRRTSPSCWTSPRPAPLPTSSGSSAPGVASTGRRRRSSPNLGISIGISRPGWTTTAWS